MRKELTQTTVHGRYGYFESIVPFCLILTFYIKFKQCR